MTRRTLIATLPFLPCLGRATEEFTSMFDGRTLEGWNVREGPQSAFHVDDGAIVIHQGSNYPAWLRYDRKFENFDFRCEFFLKGWSDSGIYIHAPEHGNNISTGMKIHLFHKQEEPSPVSAGSVFPVVAPLKVNVNKDGEWNTLRILMDWPSLQVWMNGEQVQNLDVESVPELKHRLRDGYIGIESLSYPLRFRKLQVRELPSKDRWEVLYNSPEDMAKWTVAEGEATWETLGPVLRADGLGHLATREKYRDFEFQCYIRGSRHHNGGIVFRGDKIASGKHYEIQLHDVPGATYPTGSLYHFQRAVYPDIKAEEWYPFQLIVNGRRCIVRVNGDTVADYGKLDIMEAGPIMLQAHQRGRWIEYKEIRVKRLPAAGG